VRSFDIMRKTNNSTFGNCGMLIDGILREWYPDYDLRQ
jgi:hypothetical protein